jgi:mannopine transport system substrate-binding protein
MTEIRKHRSVRRFIGLGTVAGIARQIGLALVLTSAAAAQSSEVVVATTGGAYDRALKEVWFEPFTTATGIKVSTVTATDAEQRTRAQAMATAGRVTWDIINNVDIIAESAQNRSFTRDLTAFCGQFEARKDLVEKSCNPVGVRISFNAALLAFNTQRFKNGVPGTWADFWDTARFPGPRALPSFNDPWRVFAAALLAERLNVTPPSLDAIAQMSEAARANIPNSPDAFKGIVKHDSAWIAANQARMLEAWNAWIQG